MILSLWYQQTAGNSYQTPRQALLSSISTFDKDDFRSKKRAGFDPASSISSSLTPSRHAGTAAALPPRDVQRSSPKAKEQYHEPVGGSNMDREGMRRSLDHSSSGLRRTGEAARITTPSRYVKPPECVQ